MSFGQLVIGPPGAGKTTYCNGMQQYLGLLGRKVAVVNLDPANDALPYDCAVDVRELVSLEEVQEETGLGPNGGARARSVARRHRQSHSCMKSTCAMRHMMEAHASWPIRQWRQTCTVMHAPSNVNANGAASSPCADGAQHHTADVIT